MPAAAVSPSSSARRLRSKADVRTWERSSAFSASRSSTSSRRESRLSNQSGIDVIGRTITEAAVSAGPNSSPSPRRAGSSAESVLSLRSKVIRVTQASTNAMTSPRGGSPRPR